jgi:isoleucyl-tRNA synthetase
MDLSYMESILWAFKEAWQKGLIYEGFKVMPYSWAMESPLSNFETRLDNAYRERQDPAVTVGFKLHDPKLFPDELYLLAWTTTPWTLPTNLGLAVGKNYEYVIVQSESRYFVLAAALLPSLNSLFAADHKIVKSIRGSELVGRSYEPLFPFLATTTNAFRILDGDFVTLTDGTGIVHLAPYGEDDYIALEKVGVKIPQPVDSRGCYDATITDYAGKQVFDANKDIIRSLKERGVLLKHETILHNYPHCWRTDTPLIYRPVSSWFVKVSSIKEQLLKNNQAINWIPEHIKNGQFGKWLENARDWSISRSRFWGSPIPVWKSDSSKYPRIDVYGSIAELERDFGTKVTDLHRPFIDELVRPNPDDPSGKSMMRRVPDVLDCWFESGAMPFAQVHYPFENEAWFENHFPADFIVEYVSQTRGWFYTLVVLSTALFDKHPFNNCLCHGTVLDADGKKLSKRSKNYPDPFDVFDKFGSDALRWFMLASPVIKGQDLNIDKDGRAINEVVKGVLNPLWNASYFLTMYANADRIVPEYRSTLKESPCELDQYLGLKIEELKRKCTLFFDKYDLNGACESIAHFIEILTNWYIRRSRERFWRSSKSGEENVVTALEKKWAYDALYSGIVTLLKVAAPLLPLLTEYLYRTITKKESVHLENWDSYVELDDEGRRLLNAMDLVREVCSLGLSIRDGNNLRTRLPLSSLSFASHRSKEFEPFIELIKDELNVKEVFLSDDVSSFGNYLLKINSKVLGPKVGGKMKSILTAAKLGLWKKDGDGFVVVDGVKLESSDYELTLVIKEGFTGVPLRDGSGVVILDTTVTDALKREGLVRDLVRQIQQGRRVANLNVSDSITLYLHCNTYKENFLTFKSYIQQQTLAGEVHFQLPSSVEVKFRSKFLLEPDGEEIEMLIA